MHFTTHEELEKWISENYNGQFHNQNTEMKYCSVCKRKTVQCWRYVGK